VRAPVDQCGQRHFFGSLDFNFLLNLTLDPDQIWFAGGGGEGRRRDGDGRAKKRRIWGAIQGVEECIYRDDSP
jgi:hypothetical protein